MDPPRTNQPSGGDLMEVNIRLPPRKRLLAELKKQNCESMPSSSAAHSLTSDGFSNNDLFDKMGIDYMNSKVTLEEIVEVSKSAAKRAAQVAVAAKALATEKATIAAEAAAAAKSALELVAVFEVEEDGPREDTVIQHNMEKQLPVKLLYKRLKWNHENDEEFARKLNQSVNSSPPISKIPANTDQNSDRPEKLKKALVESISKTCERKLSLFSVEGNFV